MKAKPVDSDADQNREPGKDKKPFVETPTTVEVKVGGKVLSHQVVEIRLTQHVHDHHTLIVRIDQVGVQATDRDFIADSEIVDFLGKPINLRITPDGNMIPTELELTFTGLVTEVRLENSVDGLNVIVLRAKSPTIQFDGARKNAMFHEMKGSEVIDRIVRSREISVGKMESSNAATTYIVQYGETDYDFILRLASGSGLFACYDGTKFHLRKPHTEGQVQLDWRKTLGAFNLLLGTAPVKFKTTLFDPINDKVLRQESEKVPAKKSLRGLGNSSEKASKKIYGDADFHTMAMAKPDLKAVDTVLGTQRDRAIGSMVQCVGQSGVPAVRVGTSVAVAGLGELDGAYWIEEIEHVVVQGGQYHNRFTGVPIDAAAPRPRRSAPSITQLQSAVVTDNADPESLGRIKVKFHWFAEEETPWVRYVSVHAGDGHGWYSLPEIGDEVLVGFEFGDPASPVALGSVYNKTNKPAGDTANSDNDVKLLVTRSGHQVVLTDKSGSEEIRIVTKDQKCQVVMDAAAPSITISTDGDITLSGVNIKIDASGKLELSSGSDCKIDAGANLAEQAGANVDLKGSGNVTVQGAMIKLN